MTGKRKTDGRNDNITTHLRGGKAKVMHEKVIG